MGRWIRRIVVGALVVVVIAAGAVAGAYYSGMTIPVFHDLTPVAVSNWNRTAKIKAEVDHDTRVLRRDGRIHFLVDLQMPEAAGRLQAFLDGGRTEIVACGPQKLVMHSLKNGRVAIDGDTVRIRGNVDMELAGPVKLRDDWPMASAVRVGHDRTSVWANVVSLDIANVPEPMIEALLKSHSRFVYTREQILDLVARSMRPEDAAALAAHRDDLDLSFETVRPAMRGNVLVLDAEISADEAAALAVLRARLFAAAGAGARSVARGFGPARAHAQLKLDELRKGLEGAGKKILKDVVKDPEAVLKDPNKALETIWRGLPECKVTF